MQHSQYTCFVAVSFNQFHVYAYIPFSWSKLDEIKLCAKLCPSSKSTGYVSSSILLTIAALRTVCGKQCACIIIILHVYKIH